MEFEELKIFISESLKKNGLTIVGIETIAELESLRQENKRLKEELQKHGGDK